MFNPNLLSTLFFVVVTLNSALAQDNTVYEIPFSIGTGLLVFKGQLNGVETNFAFDTGAAEGIANANDEKNKGVERQNSTQRILDANNKIVYLQSAITKKLSIGGYTFDNVRASITDMQYLYCMNLYLLGADVIRKLNWEIDFEKMVLKASKNRVETNEAMAIIPVKYYYNRPIISLTINDISFDKVLIDIGFNGSMTIPNTGKKVQALLQTKRQQNLLIAQISSSFAAAGQSKPSLQETIVVDSFMINNHCYQGVPADFKADTDFKIGLKFFSSTCDKLIINNSDKKYYLQLKAKPNFKNSFTTSILLKDGKLKVSYVTISDNPSENVFTIDEEVKSINGKTASDFKSDCEFLTWYYTGNHDTRTIEKTNGQIINVQRSPNR